MGDRSTIEWTHSTWNPVTGCTKVSRGCDNCYAHVLAHRRLKKVYTAQLPVVDSPANREDPFAVRVWPERLSHPSSWTTPRLVFVNSMSDLFHADIPRDFARRVFEVMLEEDRHVYQVLTKRPNRARRFVEGNADLFDFGSVPTHIWIGTSVEDEDVGYRVDHLRDVPATIRFLSCEPLLGRMSLDLDGIHWVIAGGESGPGFRPPNPDWVREIRDQCQEQEVPFFFKQWGGHTPKAGGRTLDGRTWDEMPATKLGVT